MVGYTVEESEIGTSQIGTFMVEDGSGQDSMKDTGQGGGWMQNMFYQLIAFSTSWPDTKFSTGVMDGLPLWLVYWFQCVKNSMLLSTIPIYSLFHCF